ncbi:MAG TPA: DUF1801 domain-containing protein [Stenotrophomonas sp.]|jgi:hypothetical protein
MTTRKTAAKPPASKKTPAKQTPANGVAAKQAAVSKAPAKKAPTKKAIVKKAAATKTASKKPIAKKAVATKTAAEKAPAKSATTQNVAAGKAIAKKAPAPKTAPRTQAPHAPRAADADRDPSTVIDARIRELGDWRSQTLARVRTLIHEADPEVVEAWKWRGVPVWEHDGILCTGETYKHYVKLTFANGAKLEDPAKLFNASLEGNTRRAIDLHEHDEIDERALQNLIRGAVALNTSRSNGKHRRR